MEPLAAGRHGEALDVDLPQPVAHFDGAGHRTVDIAGGWKAALETDTEPMYGARGESLRPCATGRSLVAARSNTTVAQGEPGGHGRGG
jgi:hypothetical protein